jgi:hypothetical protein
VISAALQLSCTRIVSRGFQRNPLQEDSLCYAVSRPVSVGNTGHFFIIDGVGLSPYLSAQVPRYCGHFGLLYKPQMIDEDEFWSNWWN